MKLKDIISLSIEKLKNKNIEDAYLKVKILIMHILKVSKEYLIIHDLEEFPDEKMKEYNKKIERLQNNEPIQYIVNHQEFFGLDFYVDENVLIPQPDTEILVEECINILGDVENFPQEKLENEKNNIKILDLCTGSGIIGICLGKKIKKSDIYASDISQKALEIAEKNANQNEVNIKFIKSDLFEKINEKFNMIVSNPPYIEKNTLDSLSEEVKKEPILALDGGQDGLDFYRKIAEKAKEHLYDNGYLALEIGYNQKNDVIKILKENNYKNIYSKKDFGNNDRIIIAQK